MVEAVEEGRLTLGWRNKVLGDDARLAVPKAGFPQRIYRATRCLDQGQAVVCRFGDIDGHGYAALRLIVVEPIGMHENGHVISRQPVPA